MTRLVRRWWWLAPAYLAAQLVAAFLLPGLTALVFGDLLPRVYAAVAR